jgi:hypothetical protein
MENNGLRTQPPEVEPIAADGDGRRIPFVSIPHHTLILHAPKKNVITTLSPFKLIRVGASKGNLGQDLRRGRQSSPWIALWALRMITLPRS